VGGDSIAYLWRLTCEDLQSVEKVNEKEKCVMEEAARKEAQVLSLLDLLVKRHNTGAELHSGTGVTFRPASAELVCEVYEHMLKEMPCVCVCACVCVFMFLFVLCCVPGKV
jgi:hypothetical protein